MSNYAIYIHNVSKSYRIKSRNQKEEFLALKNIELAVPRGRVMGIIGSNGAGKSTLLKILSRITYPTEGYAEVNGRLSSLLEVGTGFHPELSGLENIYLNGAILGMRAAEIKKRLDAIIDFAGTEKFLYTPLKHYSSGMYVRLAFSVAAHLKSDILLIDEVLAVGDADFQKKCISKIGETTREEGRTVLFVSHNINVARSLCDEMVQLAYGEIVQRGSAAEVSDRYLLNMQEQAQKVPLAQRTDRSGNGTGRVTGIQFADSESGAQNLLKTGSPAHIYVDYELFNPQKRWDIIVHIALFNHNGSYLTTLSNSFTGLSANGENTRGRLRCTVPRWPLMAGNYYCGAFLTINGLKADHVHFAQQFQTTLGDYYGSGSFFEKRNPGVFIDQEWEKEKG